jgi:adenine-specific DNA-methyltransferase
LVFARDLKFLKENDVRWREHKAGLDAVYARAEEMRTEFGEDWTAMHRGMLDWFRALPDEHPSKAHEHFTYMDERGLYFPDNLRSPNPRPNLVYTFKGYEPHPNGWAYGLQKMEQLDLEDRLFYPEKEGQRLKIKSYLHEHETWAPASVFYRDRRAASKALASLMGEEVFDYPKDCGVLGRLIHTMTSADDLILDFFAGSGSTGQAVWEQDRKDQVSRRWVLVQVPEKPDDSEFGKNATKAGYGSIFEITVERLRRAAATIGDDALGFRVFRARETNLAIDAPVVADEGMTGQSYIEAVLSKAHGSPVRPDATDEAVAWEVVLKATGTKLDATVATHDIGGVAVYEFTSSDDSAAGRLFVSLGAFTADTANALGVGADDTLILRGDKVDDATTLTLAPRLQKNLVLLERVAREVSL